MDMNMNEYLEVINGNDTYRTIAKYLLKDKTVGIGWTDEESTHYDIIFTLGLNLKCGSFQRGIKADYLYVSIIDHTSYAFKTDSIKIGDYVVEKLRMPNTCGYKINELINGIIIEINKIKEFEGGKING